eukprot:scaffold136966_cov30-Tisochrysis_lutea.AAC.1
MPLRFETRQVPGDWAYEHERARVPSAAFVPRPAGALSAHTHDPLVFLQRIRRECRPRMGIKELQRVGVMPTWRRWTQQALALAITE